MTCCVNPSEFINLFKNDWFLFCKIYYNIQALVAHDHKPGYLRGRDQEDCSLKPAWANSS
jgi:hypothetical protein